MSEDESIRITHRGQLVGLSPGGELRWKIALPSGTTHAPLPRHSCPVALEGGRTLVTLYRHAVVIDERGGVHVRWVLRDGAFLEDAPLAPSVSHSGRLLLTTVDGHIVTQRGRALCSLGRTFGYDLPPPAVLPDDSMIVSGYYGVGLAWLSPGGGVLRRLGMPEADRLPSVSRRLMVAASNAGFSAIYDLCGTKVADFAGAGLFAEHPDEGWVAQSGGAVIRLSERGEVRWTTHFEPGLMKGRYQPVVDARGRIYVAVVGGVACLDGEGRSVWRVAAGDGVPGPIAMLGPGRLGFVLADDLVVVE